MSTNPPTRRPSIAGLSGDQVDENAADDTVVGTVAASDPDGDGLTFALTDDAGGRFAIDASGPIRVADGTLLDFEIATARRHRPGPVGAIYDSTTFTD